VLPDDLLQQIDIFSESLASGRRQRTRGERAVVLIRLGHGNIAFLLQGFDVGGQIAIGHPGGVAQFRERKLRRGGEHGHDRQPAFLVDQPIQLQKRFRVHATGVFFSVK